MKFTDNHVTKISHQRDLWRDLMIFIYMSLFSLMYMNALVSTLDHVLLHLLI